MTIFYADLDEWAILNIDMDDGTKEHWLRSKDSHTQQQYIFGEPWPFWVAGRKVTKAVQETIMDLSLIHISEPTRPY